MLLDRALSGATTPGQSGPGSDGNEGVPKAPALLEPHHQIVLCHIQDTHRGGSYPSAEKQLVYSTAPADWAIPAQYHRKTLLE